MFFDDLDIALTLGGFDDEFRRRLVEDVEHDPGEQRDDEGVHEHRHADSGEIEQWIEIGQPEEPRLRKACGKAGEVKLYAFGKSADTWWKINGDAIAALPRIEVWQFAWEEVQALAALLDRTMQLNVSVVGGVIYVDNGQDSVSLEPRLLG